MDDIRPLGFRKVLCDYYFKEIASDIIKMSPIHSHKNMDTLLI
ncbi:MAG: hypothetical protein VX335_02250 [Pseudomonadota bacterium]|nr:hypothetical protein [Pseudomonadota bacterium]